MEALSLSFAVHEQALLSTMPRKQMNVTLSILDLSWNSVRMASGVALGKSMAHNSALMELRLAHNSLADEGCQEVRMMTFPWRPVAVRLAPHCVVFKMHHR